MARFGKGGLGRYRYGRGRSNYPRSDNFRNQSGSSSDPYNKGPQQQPVQDYGPVEALPPSQHFQPFNAPVPYESGGPGAYGAAAVAAASALSRRARQRFPWGIVADALLNELLDQLDTGQADLAWQAWPDYLLQNGWEIVCSSNGGGITTSVGADCIVPNPQNQWPVGAVTTNIPVFGCMSGCLATLDPPSGTYGWNSTANEWRTTVVGRAVGTPSPWYRLARVVNHAPGPTPLPGGPGVLARQDQWAKPATPLAVRPSPDPARPWGSHLVPDAIHVTGFHVHTAVPYQLVPYRQVSDWPQSMQRGHERRRVRPAPRRFQRPAVVVDTGTIGGAASPPRTRVGEGFHNQLPPLPGVKERKFRVGGLGVILTTLSHVTEATEIVEALYWCLPESVRPQGFTSIGTKARTVHEHGDSINIECAIASIIQNQLEDAAIGRLSKGRVQDEQAAGFNRPPGLPRSATWGLRGILESD